MHKDNFIVVMDYIRELSDRKANKKLFFFGIVLVVGYCATLLLKQLDFEGMLLAIAGASAIGKAWGYNSRVETELKLRKAGYSVDNIPIDEKEIW